MSIEDGMIQVSATPIADNERQACCDELEAAANKLNAEVSELAAAGKLGDALVKQIEAVGFWAAIAVLRRKLA